jgi:hypothetical protein
MCSRIVFFTGSPSDRIEYNTINNIYSKFSLIGWESIFIRRSSVRDVFSIISHVRCADAVVVHSPLVKALGVALIAFLLRKKLICFVWDFYPVILSGRRFDRRPWRIFADLFENVVMARAALVFVPTSDFQVSHRFYNFKALPFWPPREYCARPPSSARSYDSLKLIFAGQVNATRDLESCFNTIRKISSVPVEFYVASSSNVPKELLNAQDVHFIGSLGQQQLLKRLGDFDFGLISLSKKFEGPGFPSKVFDYAAAGLPILYHGPTMNAYEKIIEQSGVGMCLDKLQTLDFSLRDAILSGYDEKFCKFNASACLSDESAKELSKIILNAISVKA